MHMRTLVAVALSAAACGNDDSTSPPPSQAPEIEATAQIMFSPNSISVEQGGSVTWRFGAVPHNVVFSAVAGRPEDIGGQNANVAISRTFAQSGTFAYSCTLHPGMAGSVTVTAPRPGNPADSVSP